MLHQLLTKLDNHVGFEKVSAHCDIPCKIYDPISAQLAALSVIRFTDLINELSADNGAQLVRLVREKEIHAEKVKQEVRVIWGDYFKAPQIEQYPDVHDLVHNIMMAGSACKQHVDRDKSLQLLALVNQFAGYFWHSKGVQTVQATCPYPPAEQVVYPKLY
ncbi:superoxide dismutase, Ni [Alteromonas sp. C1M14]|uniref:superoxide dismutase, Ni n=1 Tax=Alteromonas sp. C1M14 TaxID=2841567 RepID=UPI001C0859C6|nr:superoxide dismutase, Ni [Alteromonas sp. C1M14]MBU2979914.1 superoxide dismutase, Ni [Alteromonas sp. C1M14]